MSPAQSCTLGFRVKSGWATAVLIANSAKAPSVIDSRVIELADPDVAHSRQPYHARKSRAWCAASNASLVARSPTYWMSIANTSACAARPSSPPHLPIRPPSPTNTCEPMRPKGDYSVSSSWTALSTGGVTVRVVLEREVYELLGKALHRSPSQAKATVAALGEGVGRWRAEQKVAAAAAWLVR